MKTRKTGEVLATKKPVTVRAVQMTKARRFEYAEWPDWLLAAWNLPNDREGAAMGSGSADDRRLRIRTLEGLFFVNPGDWIIQGVEGEIYPCKPDIFEATYDYDRAAHEFFSPPEVKA